MKLSEALSYLYFSDIDFVIRALNSSLFAKDYPFDKEKPNIIHTGFVFEMHNGKENELFYDFVNGKLIRQPKFRDNPPVLGLVYFFWNDWIQVWNHEIALTVNEKDNELIVTPFENADDVYSFDKFDLISSEPGKNITIKGLRKRIEERVFFNGNTFTRMIDDDDVDWL